MFVKMQVTITVTLLTLASCDNATQIETLLSCRELSSDISSAFLASFAHVKER